MEGLLSTGPTPSSLRESTFKGVFPWPQAVLVCWGKDIHVPGFRGRGHSETGDVTVQTINVKKYEFKDSETQTELPVEKVPEEIIQDPMRLKFKIPKILSSDIYDSYLEEPMLKVMPKTVLHPLDGVGEFNCFRMGVKNR